MKLINNDRKNLKQPVTSLEMEIFQKNSELSPVDFGSELGMRKNFRTPIKEILLSTSLQFLLSPIRSKRLLIKIINISFLIFFICLSVYFVITNIIDYLKYDTTTSIETIYENEADLPTVTFCSYKETFILINEFMINNKLIEDWENNFEKYSDVLYGSCFRFNSGLNMSSQSVPINKQKQSGFDYGFSIDFISNSSQILVYMHNQTMKPFSIQKGFYIVSGFYNYFILKRVYDQKLEKPYNDCFKNVFDFQQNRTILEYFRNKSSLYTQRECKRMFQVLKFIETSNCNCSVHSLDDELYQKCFYKNNNKTKECYTRFMDTFNIDHFLQYCPRECDFFSYDITPYTLFNNYSDNKFHLRVYYEDLKYTHISQQAKTEFVGLISNIGGSLGLFVGVSFISFLEMFEVLAEFLFIYFE